MSKTPEPWTEAELRDQFSCYEDKDRPWSLDLYNQYGEYFDRAIAKIKADAWEEGVKVAVDSDCLNPACGSCKGCDTILVNPYEVQE